MGIIDTILGFFKSTTKDTRAADNAVKLAKSSGQNGSYTMASIQSFYALEKIGEQYGDRKREVHITAREYAGQMAETGLTSTEELEPIIVNFELAKYAETEIKAEDYGKVDEVLTVVHKRFRSGRPVKSRSGRQTKGTPRRRTPKRGATTGRSRTRQTKGTPRKRRTKK